MVSAVTVCQLPSNIPSPSNRRTPFLIRHVAPRIRTILPAGLHLGIAGWVCLDSWDVGQTWYIQGLGDSGPPTAPRSLQRADGPQRCPHPHLWKLCIYHVRWQGDSADGTEVRDLKIGRLSSTHSMEYCSITKRKAVPMHSRAWRHRLGVALSKRNAPPKVPCCTVASVEHSQDDEDGEESWCPG